MRLPFLFPLLFLLLEFAACSGPGKTPPADKPAAEAAPAPLEALKTQEAEIIESQMFEDREANYRLTFPRDWTRQKMPDAMVFLMPKEDTGDAFQENVTVTLQDLSTQPMTLEQFIEMSMRQIKESEEAKILSVRDATVSGVKAKAIVTDLNYDGNQLMLKQLCMIRGTTAYILTYTARPKAYARFEPMATEVMQSFQLVR